MSAAALVVDQPGVYRMPAEAYHVDPVAGGSLSSTGARRLLPPSCPARYRWEQEHGRLPRREFDVGHAAHRLVLGDGADLAIVDADTYRTKAAQAARDEAYAAGRTPLLSHEHEQVLAMAAALRAHPVASALFAPGSGQPEQALFWVDAEFGVWRRALLDWLPDGEYDRRLIVPDYKTCHSVEPAALSKALAQHGYYQQGAWYLDGVKALGQAGDIEPAFVLVCQEKDPPYLITIAEPDAAALEWGRMRNRKAMAVYRECQRTGIWPAYTDKVLPLPLPRWAEYEHDAALVRGDYDVEESA